METRKIGDFDLYPTQLLFGHRYFNEWAKAKNVASLLRNKKKHLDGDVNQLMKEMEFSIYSLMDY